MARIRVVLWREQEPADLLEAVRQAGHDPEYCADGQQTLREIRQSPPDAVLVDMVRRPSYGREVASYLRTTKATRHIPLIFVDGAEDKVEAVRNVLPDAVFTTRARLRQAIEQALEQRPLSPVSPVPMMERYWHRSTPEKLGIKDGTRVAVIDAPGDYRRAIGDVGERVEFLEDPDQPGDVTLWFVTDPEAFREGLTRMRRWAGSTRLWILWRKNTKRTQKSLVTENLIRESALAVGLVDYKVCSVDATWSAIAIAKRRAPRA